MICVVVGGVFRGVSGVVTKNIVGNFEKKIINVTFYWNKNKENSLEIFF